MAAAVEPTASSDWEAHPPPPSRRPRTPPRRPSLVGAAFLAAAACYAASCAVAYRKFDPSSLQTALFFAPASPGASREEAAGEALTEGDAEAMMEDVMREWSLSDRFRVPPRSGNNGARAKRLSAEEFRRRVREASAATEEATDSLHSDPNRAYGNATPAEPEPEPEPRTGGMHVCTCLSSSHPRNAKLPPKPKRIRWLHAPKTGTSFVSTLWSYASSTSERYIDLSANSHFCSPYDDASHSMYDFVLMRRYPWEMYGAPNFFPASNGTNVDRGSDAGDKTMDEDVPLGLVGGTQHGPLTPSQRDRSLLRSDRYARIKHTLRHWGSELHDHGMTVAAFFRRPEERIVSAYYDGRHSNGFAEEQFREVIRASVQRQPKHRCVVGGKTYRNPLECFARFPGVAGCQARMLTGQTCADGLLGESGLENVRDAVDVVWNHLEFAGLTEEWDESVCQFHRLYASRPDRTAEGGRAWDAPLQGEFSNRHARSRAKAWDLRHLNGFADVADSVVYEAAKVKFERMVGEERCHRYVTEEEWDELRTREENGTTRSASKESAEGSEVAAFLPRDKGGRLCAPKSCSDLGKQCGEWDDGCGRTIICGMCSIGRTGLPSTWRVQCVNGSCVDYCPPWDDRGYWFPSGDSPIATVEFWKALGLEERKEYLTAIDAVMICEMACGNYGEAGKQKIEGTFSAFHKTGLCRCGGTSKSFWANLTRDDFSTAHNLETMCAESNARKGAVLFENDTQPLCCPFLDRKADPPDGWQRLFTMGRSNLEGEYFAHVPMGCGTFVECEAAARHEKAEMAVFDIFNSMCCLARNVVDLGNYFTVTKDNTYRFILDLREEGT